MSATETAKVFIDSETIPWEETGPGVRRKILSYDASLMVVKVQFEKGGIGALHKHPHIQISYIESGVFEVEIDGVKKIQRAGDAYFAPSNLVHGVVCLEAGVLIDSFSPMREDFIG